MRFAAKMILFFVLSTTLLIGALSYGLSVYVQNYFSGETYDTFRTLAKASEESYTSFIGTMQARTADWGSDGYMRNTVEQILGLPEGQRGALEQTLSTYLITKKMPLDPLVALVDIVDKDGTVIVSTIPDRVGLNITNEDKEGNYRFYDALNDAKFGDAYVSDKVDEEDELHEPTISATAGMFSTKSGPQNEPIPLHAVIILHFSDVQRLRDILNTTATLPGGEASPATLFSRYQTIDSYLVNQDGYLITASRFATSTILTQKVDTLPVQICQQQHQDVSAEYTNYLGYMVIGTSMCLNGGQQTLIVEAKSSEVFGPVTVFKESLFWGVIAFIVVMSLLIVFGVLYMLRGLQYIMEVAEKVSRNDMSARVKTLSKDEIGKVASALNKMLDRIEESHRELLLANAQFEKKTEALGQTEIAMLNVLEDSRALEAALQSERDKMDAIISSMGEGLFVVDSSYRVLIMNKAAERMLDIKKGGAIGSDIRSVLTVMRGKAEMPEAERPTVRTVREHLSITVGLDDDVYFKTVTGKLMPVSIATSPIDIGDLKGAIVVFRDISREKALDEAKTSFISIASHQLRTPLTSIRWYSEMLLDEDMGALTEGQKEFAQQVYDGALRLHETIDTLLSLSRMESGTMKGTPVEIGLKPFVAEIVHTLEPIYAPKHLEVTTDVPDGMKVTLDTFMLHEVITNLIANSIRYTDDGGKIQVHCEEKDGAALCSVADNGIGIPDNQKDKIFQKFFRADNAASKVPDGSGLGLALVKGFVETWGGNVSFESTVGQGTTFRFTIPHGTVVSVSPKA